MSQLLAMNQIPCMDNFVLENGVRGLSIALLYEPDLIGLARAAHVHFIHPDALDFLREELVKFSNWATLITNMLKQSFQLAELDIIAAIRIIEELDSSLLVLLPPGIERFHNDNVVEFLTSQRNNKVLNAPDYWDVFSRALKMPLAYVSLRFSLVEIRVLYESCRAFPLTNSEFPILQRVCTSLDVNTFRNVLSFIGAKRTFGRGITLFDSDILDNMSAEMSHNSVAAALAAGVENIHEIEDEYHGTTYLHTMASFGKTDDCRTLLQLGANPNKPCRAFEAGDGWGELEFGQFTPLHFAASNGHAETARVLLQHGANSTALAGWDGGSILPAYSSRSSDYWYTRKQTPLQQAARGNHVKVINVLLDGPSEAEAHLAGSWRIDVDYSRQEEDFEDESGNAESINMTALVVAIMFARLDAALALVKRGARLDTIGTHLGYGRKCLLKGVMSSKIFREFVLSQVSRMKDKAALAFLAKYSGSGDGSEDEKADGGEDEEDPWYRDDWDSEKVPEGDAKEEGAVEGVRHAAPLLELLSEIHPTLMLSRNAQQLLSKVAEVSASLLTRQLAEKGSFTETGVEEAVATWLHGSELLTFAMKQIQGTSEAKFKETIIEQLQSDPSGIYCEVDFSSEQVEASLILVARAVEYILGELLEIGGNATRDCHLEVVNPTHIVAAISNDVELKKVFGGYLIGDFYTVTEKPQNSSHLNKIFSQAAMQKQKCKVDLFASQGWLPAALKNNGISEIELAEHECSFFSKLTRGPIMSAATFKGFLTSQLTVPVSEHASLLLQLVIEKRLLQQLRSAREHSMQRILNSFVTSESLYYRFMPYELWGVYPLAVSEEERVTADEFIVMVNDDSKYDDLDVKAENQQNPFSGSLDLCYADFFLGPLIAEA